MPQVTSQVKILAVETSCDETAAALVQVEKISQHEFNAEVLSEHVFSQIDTHKAYGGVIPEIASRAHLERIQGIVDTVLEKSKTDLSEVDALAATTGPGLLGGLIIGHVYTKTLAQGIQKPFWAVNHIESHILTSGLTDNIQPEYTVMLVSGGHCQVVAVEDIGAYQVIGETRDDSVGECFDKVATMLGLPYPGGPHVEKEAKNGDAGRYSLPMPLLHEGLDFSFSGLKTAVRQVLEKEVHTPQDKADLCASFQQTVATLLAKKAQKALEITGHKTLVVAGGVAANGTIRAELQKMCDGMDVTFYAPPLKYCTDNAAMIGYCAGVRALRGADDRHHAIVPRWPLVNMNWRVHGK